MTYYEYLMEIAERIGRQSRRADTRAEALNLSIIAQCIMERAFYAEGIGA